MNIYLLVFYKLKQILVLLSQFPLQVLPQMLQSRHLLIHRMESQRLLHHFHEADLRFPANINIYMSADLTKGSFGHFSSFCVIKN